MIRGILKAISIETYGIYPKKGVVHKFTVKDLKKRRKIDLLQGQVVSFAKDIKPLLK